jgi:hypothetical protein
MATHSITWTDKHEEQLLIIQKYSKQLFVEYHNAYIRYKKKLEQYRIPIIIISALIGFLSISNAGYIPIKYSVYISLIVGIFNLIITIVTLIEQFKKINEIMHKSLNSYINFKKINDEISFILRTSVDERESNGNTIVKDYFQKFQLYYSESPVLNNLSEDLFNFNFNNINTDLKNKNNDNNINSYLFSGIPIALNIDSSDNV